MNNIKNLLIAVLTGLLALSLFTQPAGGASPKTSSTAQSIEYDYCLNLHSDRLNDLDESDSRFIGKTYYDLFDPYVSLIISACGPYKPTNSTDAKALQYERCLALGTDLRDYAPEDTPRLAYLKPDSVIWITSSYKRLIPYVHKVCAKYRP